MFLLSELLPQGFLWLQCGDENPSPEPGVGNRVEEDRGGMTMLEVHHRAGHSCIFKEQRSDVFFATTRETNRLSDCHRLSMSFYVYTLMIPLFAFDPRRPCS